MRRSRKMERYLRNGAARGAQRKRDSAQPQARSNSCFNRCLTSPIAPNSGGSVPLFDSARLPLLEGGDKTTLAGFISLIRLSTHPKARDYMSGCIAIPLEPLLLTVQRIDMSNAQRSEEQFYSSYSWCLNPALSIHDLLQRFQEELDRHESLSGWQREESKANLYLFACALACTADDYFALHLVNLSPLARRLRRFRAPIALGQAGIDILYSAIKFRDHAAWRWRRRWQDCIASVCRLLLCEGTTESEEFHRLRNIASPLTRARLPHALLQRRMRLPEAFRSQDATHHDVVAMIRKFCAAFSERDRMTLLVGFRSAGAYFAPLMAEYLKQQSWSHVSWISIRPKNGVSLWEAQQLQRAARKNARVLVIDDYPSTGHTFRLALELIAASGIRTEQMAILAPTHQAQPNWVRLAGIDERIPVFTVQPNELHKVAEFFAPAAVGELCTAYYAREGWRAVRVLRDTRLDEINDKLAEHSKDGHHVREKRVFALELQGPYGEKAEKKVFLKSVGWGWLGYHAYLAGTQLEGFVPRVLGLRNGLLVSEWIDRNKAAAAPTIGLLASYVAARARHLRLAGDCRLESRTYRWTGSDEIVDILRAVYGPYVNRLKKPALRKELFKYVTAVPTFLDGKMHPEEWLDSGTGIYKSDFEHHNFGGAEADIVDPAYDLAATIFEFQLAKDAERCLVEIYQRESGDTSDIAGRLLLHKILYGTMAMRHAHNAVVRGKEPEKNNTRRHHARNFLVYAMNDFCSRLVGAARPSRWSDQLFFLDLDRVFDQELLGFPHATRSGLQSLSLLHSRGFSIVLNTGRSVQHVRDYCDAYGLAGGVAEYGAVFVDAIRQREVPLVDKIGTDQLAECRAALKKLPGVFIDPGYEYSIRAHRYGARGTTGLETAELNDLLRRSEFSHLTYISRETDSHIVQKRTGKGPALRFVRREVGSDRMPVTAIGDSQYDIGMLKAAEYAYAPANCSVSVRELAGQGQCRIVGQRFQKGLLAAVKHRLRQTSAKPAISVSTVPPEDHFNGLLQAVLKAADRGLLFQTFVMLSWWNL
jgi:hydroxymethylpyrimidine pyrophosphatase-like HAD family hydrolase/orotate phosphoribosyltransferase